VRARCAIALEASMDLAQTGDLVFQGNITSVACVTPNESSIGRVFVPFSVNEVVFIAFKNC
jgi:hypothetical protein